MENRGITEFTRQGMHFSEEQRSSSGEVRRESLSGEFLDFTNEQEPTYLSPRFRQEYVSSFVAFGHTPDREELGSESPTRFRHSSLDSSRVGGDVLRELQSKDEVIADLRQEISDQKLKSSEERELLQRELKTSKRLVLDLQHALKTLEAVNKRATHELQLKVQQVETLGCEVDSLQEQLSARDRDLQSFEALKLSTERMTAQWKAERTQLLRELDQASSRHLERSKEDRGKRAQEVDPLDLTSKYSPSKASPSSRVRSKSQGKLKKKAEDTPRGPTPATCRRLLKDVMDTVGVTQPGELMAELKSLLKRGQSAIACDQFVGQICDTVAQLSPPGTFARQPSLQQVWKWVQRLIDEYMILRKAREEAAHGRVTLQRLSEVMSANDLVEKAELWRDMEREMKRLLGLGEGTESEEVLKTLREHMAR